MTYREFCRVIRLLCKKYPVTVTSWWNTSDKHHDGRAVTIVLHTITDRPAIIQWCHRMGLTVNSDNPERQGLYLRIEVPRRA